MATTLWSRSFKGQPLDLLAGSGRVLFCHGPDETSARSAHVECLNLDGNTIWSEIHLRPLLLQENGLCFLHTAHHEPRIMTLEGQVVRKQTDRLTRKDYTWDETPYVDRRGETILIASTDTVFLATPNFEVYQEFRRPLDHPISGYTQGTFYWNEEDEVFAREIGGENRSLGTIPPSAIEEAMAQWELDTGTPAFEAMIFGDDGNLTPTLLGRRLRSSFHWRLRVDPERELLFMANGSLPHIVVCLTTDGSVKWARQLSGVCCGEPPRPLANGLYVAHSGCDGSFSWLDSDGDVVHRAVPRLGWCGRTLPRGSWCIGVTDGLLVFDDNAEALLRHERASLCDVIPELRIAAVARTGVRRARLELVHLDG